MSRDPVPEHIRQQIMPQAQGAMRLSLAWIGVANHLFATLDRGPLDVAALAAAGGPDRQGVDAGYVQRWADAAFAFGLLTRDGDAFGLSELGAAFLPDRPGSMMPLAFMASLTSHMAERAAGLMRTGERPGEKVLGERETLLPWFGPMLETNFGSFFAEQILPGLPELAALGEKGGLAVDLGCGNGWYLRRLVARYPKLRGVGLDMVPENIGHARAQAAAEGLSDRLDFHEGDLHHFTVDQPADLVAMNRALHHVWGDGPDKALTTIRDHLAPGGLAVIWEPRWPDAEAVESGAMADHPKLRGMAFQNLAEHVQGNRFLRPDEVVAAFAGVGMDANVHLFADGAEMVIVARKPA